MTTTDLNQFAMTRALWRENRIMHVRAFAFPGTARLKRLGIRSVPSGYFKCGSAKIPDWVTKFRAVAWNGKRWHVVSEQRGLKRTKKDQPVWFNLDGLETAALQLEALECAVDGEWTGWDLVSGAFVVVGESPIVQLPRDTRLQLTECRPTRGAILLPGEVRFQTKYMTVGFGLTRAGFRFLSVDDEAQGRTARNLLQTSSVAFRDFTDCWTQGIRLHPVGAPRAVALLAHQVRGTVAVRGRTVTYDVEVPKAGQRYRLNWEIEDQQLHLTAERIGDRALRVWNSSAWHMAFDSRVAPVTNLGQATKTGEAGLEELPVLMHAPAFGTWCVNANGAASWRADSVRPLNTVTSELKLGEEAQPEGDYLLLPGRHKAEIDFAVMQHKRPVRSGTPKIVQRALNRCSITSMTYRPDTTTFTNNGNSMHGIICADSWSALVPVVGRLLPNLHARDLLRDSLERHLNGGPGYGCGSVVTSGKRHYVEDEYIMSGTAFLLSVAESGLKWDKKRRESINAEIKRMRGRDLDGDGLVESNIRIGISGQHQWATSWYDVISFGWKDAFANALLYPALLKLGQKQWAEKLRKSFWKEFYNEQTGWFAGWRSKDNQLHDYAFLFVNGAAVCAGLVDKKQGRAIIGRLWEEMQRMGPPDYRLGLPGNLWNIPYDDLAIPMAEGIYENKALTLSQASHFIEALYHVGMTKEGDALLHPMLESLANGTAFGGCGSGVDWRRWDGVSCGYEGLLCDQFRLIATAMKRYGKKTKS